MWLQAVVGEEGLAGDAADVSWMNSWFVLYNNSMASMYACRHAKIQPMAPTMQFARDVDISYNTHCRVTATGEVPVMLRPACEVGMEWMGLLVVLRHVFQWGQQTQVKVYWAFSKGLNQN
ncbi:hypothetical protein CIHG_10015 [Coccidioides immitis H538.4]|uniref:Uncharacterized protein n=3 Tax=Coccidioides immitis TaxID=5501 RepID=A0A0J8TFX9_COCIT|nr:hypothetical protein CIRG_05078 [Coccidioides immitis RMSCC 2394]KMU72552.1 hypothetical protein CISG_09539 [Coccidioides immitis RMSCC 3703]KMU92214.1 hypothetical protein CIHG_10015 [Coccidioides immitis H538.4]